MTTDAVLDSQVLSLYENIRFGRRSIIKYMTTVSKRKRQKDKRELGKCELFDFCESKGFTIRDINEYQFRVNEKVDVYPTGRKFCVLSRYHPLWKSYVNVAEIEKYLTNTDAVV